MATPPTRIRTRAHIDAAAVHLCEACEHMDLMIGALEEPIPTRLRPGGFEALLRSIVSQQVSVASAAAIWGRLEQAVDPLTPENFLRKRAATLRKVGLSAQKARYGRALAEAIARGELDLTRLPRMGDEDAIAHLTQVPGIGQWTAEIYLMFSLGRPDVFPSGDLALQNTYQLVAELEDRPTAKEMAEIANRWSPYRAVAARVLWTYLRHLRMMEKAKNDQTYP
jgi:DNA-3-methyladenine glycosylase II